MAYVRGKQIVDIPAISKKIPPNPLLGYDHAHSSLPSTAKSSRTSLTQNTLANQVQLYDQRCLVTGAVSDQLKPCHLVNTIRVKNSGQQEKLALKKEVVRCLSFPQTLSDGGTASSRNASSPANSSGLRSFSWTACRTVLPASVFPLG